jgi:hypothetical protein
MNIIFVFFVANVSQTIQLLIFWGDLEILTTVLSVADLPIANATFMMIRFWSKKKGKSFCFLLFNYLKIVLTVILFELYFIYLFILL